MFRPIGNIGKCVGGVDFCGHMGPMCISPHHCIYWANCVHQIVEYNLATKTWRVIHQNPIEIWFLFWYQDHLYFIVNGRDKYRIDNLKSDGDISCQLIPRSDAEAPSHSSELRSGEWVRACASAEGPIHRWWYDENWGVHAEGYYHKILKFNGESFIAGSGLFPQSIALGNKTELLLGTGMTTMIMYLDGTPIYDCKQSYQNIVGQRTTDTGLFLYIEDVTYQDNEGNMPGTTVLNRVFLRSGEPPEVKMLTNEIFLSRCINPVTGEIYVIDENARNFTLCVYEYPLKSLLDLCVDVITKSPTLRQDIPLLPRDLQDRFI